jgi:dTDP-4-amino-4,6-dideoxygalactose transaminase
MVGQRSTQSESISFNHASTIGRELEYVEQAIMAGRLSGNRAFSGKCQSMLEEALAVPKALMTTSGTAALEMAALLLDVGPDDEVIVPAFTFVSTANAFALRGARIVFCDVRSDTLNLDETSLERLITPRTKAIVPVHYGGVACNMGPILEIADRHCIAVVEDNVHGLFGGFNGKSLGTFGRLAAQSFHDTKNFTCGEGGALLINDPQYVRRAEIIHEKGTNRSQFQRGEVDWYTWTDLGSSYGLSELLAAFLYGQLEQHEHVQARRRGIFRFYADALADWALERGIRLPTVPEGVEPAYHMFYLIMPSEAARESFIADLAAQGVEAVTHYQPLHLSPMGLRFGNRPGMCPVTEEACKCLVRLPFYTTLGDDQLARVVGAAQSWQVA